MSDRETYPMLFTYNVDVIGRDYLARVAANGRILMAREDDGWWCYGVTPGGVAEGGTEDPREAHHIFRQAFAEVLFDIAERVDHFEQFKAAVASFFYETNDGFEAEWKTARAEARAKIRAGEQLAEPFNQLEVVTDDAKPQVQVLERHLTPTANEFPIQEKALAA